MHTSLADLGQISSKFVSCLNLPMTTWSQHVRLYLYTSITKRIKDADLKAIDSSFYSPNIWSYLTGGFDWEVELPQCTYHTM